MPPRLPSLALATVAVATLLGGCAESPSVELRWRILPEAAQDDPEAATPPPLTSLRQCTEVGIGNLRLTTRQGPTIVDIRDLPCFPPEFSDPDALAPGPGLDPGTYTLTLEGLRRGDDRPWPEGVAVSAEVTVGSGPPAVLAPLLLPAPPTCDDGVDNDGDGFIDAADIDCRVEDPRETNEVTTIQFFITPNFLEDNRYVTCGVLGIARFHLRIDDDPSTDRIIPCTRATSTFAHRIDPDPALNPHRIAITGRNFAGSAVTVTRVTTFEVTGPQDRPVEVNAAFTTDDLLEPLVAPIHFIPGWLSKPTTTEPRYCPPPPGSTLEVAEIGVEVVSLVTNADGGKDEVPVDPPPMIDGGTLDGELLDGEPLACLSAAILSEPLVWGDYGLRITGRSPLGEICFETPSAVRVAPGTLIHVSVPRVSTTGSCAD